MSVTRNFIDPEPGRTATCFCGEPIGVAYDPHFSRHEWFHPDTGKYMCESHTTVAAPKPVSTTEVVEHLDDLTQLEVELGQIAE